MKLILINKNPIVKKLVTLSTQKAGVALESFESIDEAGSLDADYVFIDDELIGDDTASKLGQEGAKLGCFASKDKESPEGFDICIQKPFLPTELVDILSTKSAAPSDTDTPPEKTEDVMGFEEHDDIDLDSTSESDDLEDSNTLDDEHDELDLDGLEDDLDLNLDESPDSEEDVLVDSAAEKEEKPDDLSDDLGLSDDLNLDEESTEDNLLADEEATDSAALEEESLLETDEDEEINLDLDDDIQDDEESNETAAVEMTEEPLDEDSTDIDLEENADEEDSGLSIDMPEEEPEDIQTDEIDIDEEDILSNEDEDSLAMEIEEDDELMLEDDIGEDMENNEDFTEEEDKLGGVLDENEITEIKGLLDDDEEELINQPESIEDEEDDMKLENNELASLTEEALSEALGEDEAENEIDENMAIEDTQEDIQEVPIESSTATTPDNETLQNALASMDVSKLRELLKGASVNITINFPKN